MKTKILTNTLCIIVLLVIGMFVTANAANAQVLINEFSSHSSADWVEIYAFEETDISGWTLDDEGTVTNMFTFVNGTMVGPTSGAFVAVDVSNRLDINSDTIYLYDKNNVQKDKIIYGGSANNVCAPDSDTKSVGRVGNGNAIDRFATSSKALSNPTTTTDPCPIATATPAASSSASSSPSPTPSPSVSPSSTATPKPTPTKTPTPKATSTPTVAGDNTPKDQTSVEALREGLKATPTPGPGQGDPKAFPVVGIGIALLGAGFLGVGGLYFLKTKRQGYTG